MSALYKVYGLNIESTIPLGELLLPREAGSQEADVVIRKGQCSTKHLGNTYNDCFEYGVQESLLYWSNIGAFCLYGGREIIVQPHVGVADHLLRPFLLAAVLPILLYQRGFLVLHASAISLKETDPTGGAIAFLGISGQGKSTMATALYKRGHEALSDDVIAIPIPKTEIPQKSAHTRPTFSIYSGPPHFKLRMPSVTAFNENGDSLARWSDTDESHVLPLTSTPTTSVPLRCLYVLEDGDSIQSDLLDVEDALMKVSENSYGARLFTGSELANNFVQCSQLVQHLPVFRLQRPRDFSRLLDVVSFVEEHQKFLNAKWQSS